MKADVLSYPKMWYFLGVVVFLSGVIGCRSWVKFQEKKPRRRGVQIIKTATIFEIFTNPHVRSKKNIFSWIVRKDL